MARSINELNKRLSLGDDAQVREERQERLIKELRQAWNEEKRRADSWIVKYRDLKDDLDDAREKNRDTISVLKDAIARLRKKAAE